MPALIGPGRALLAWLALISAIAGCGAGQEIKGGATTSTPYSGQAGQESGAFEALSYAADSVTVESQSISLDAEVLRVRAPVRRSATFSSAGVSHRKAKAPSRMFAQAAPPAAADQTQAETKTAVDGRSGPLLIYEARVRMAVFQVEQKQRAVMEMAKELGGHMSQRTNVTLVIRVPAQRFDEAMERLEKMGDIIDRQVTSQDVTEAFRDLHIRLVNAEQVRDRLAALLKKATNVPQSLQIEAELDRLTERIERLKGKLRSLEDRISLSKITVTFQAKREETIDPGFNLPFDWLRELGLQTLLELQ